MCDDGYDDLDDKFCNDSGNDRLGFMISGVDEPSYG